MTPTNTEAGAVIDGQYRYLLWRKWEPSKTSAAFIMLNPSTADAEADDPTIRRCIGYARNWGCGGIVVANLFAFRATDPGELVKTADPVGPRNDSFLRELLEGDAQPVIAALGSFPRAHWRAGEVSAIAKAVNAVVWCLDLTTRGYPRHPRYAEGHLLPRPFPWPPMPKGAMR